MAKFEFTATHGVHFSDDNGTWAHFQRAFELDTPDGGKCYTFSTSDSAVAARLRKVNDYGITEVSKPAESEPAKRGPGRPRKAA
jgi:hypothetical protein